MLASRASAAILTILALPFLLVALPFIMLYKFIDIDRDYRKLAKMAKAAKEDEGFRKTVNEVLDKEGVSRERFWGKD